MPPKDFETQRVAMLGHLWSNVCACQFIARSMQHLADEPRDLNIYELSSVLYGLSAMVGYVGKDLETVHQTVSNWE